MKTDLKNTYLTFEEEKIVNKASRILQWPEWTKEIPFINFPSKWAIAILPSLKGSLARFRVYYEGTIVYVSLDFRNEIVFNGEPFWEVYPFGNDVFRCPMEDTSDLINAIEEVFEQNK